MPNFSCPGATRLKEPIPEFFKCPSCASEIEIWTHENSRKCDNCGKIVTRDQVPTCIEWCEYGKECVGEEAYNRYMEAIKDKGIDKEKLEEAEKRLKELMEKAREYCQRRRDKDGKKTDN
jgi:Fe-S-cluster-containing dehydrogenase component